MKKMGIVKHGEGEVLPENEQQRTAQQEGGMDKEAREALDRENDEADGGGTTD